MKMKLILLLLMTSTSIFALPNNQRECSSTVGAVWDTRTNRCVMEQRTVQDAVKIQQNEARCEGLAEEAKRECFNSFASSQSGEPDASPFKAGAMSLVTNSALGGYHALMMLNKKGKGAAGCMSATILKFASIGSLAAEVMFRMQSKKAFKGLNEKYDTSDKYQAQVNAFKYLIEQQQAVKSSAKKHKTMYNLQRLAYGSAAVTAVLEIAIPTMKKCAGGKGNIESTGEESTDTTNTPNVTDKGLMAGLKKFGGKVTGFLKTSPGIAAVSGIAAGLAHMQFQKAKSAVKQADNNIKLIQEILERFSTSYAAAGLCSDRTNLSEPKCYCYTDAGAKNSDRQNSQVCQSQWEIDDYNKALADDLNQNKFEKPIGCFTQNRQFDQKCKCREQKDSRGQNACLKVPVGTSEMMALGANTPMPKAIGSLNRMFDGSLASGSLNNSDLSKQNASLFKFRNGVVKKLGPQIKKGLGGMSLQELEKGVLGQLKKTIPKNINSLAGTNALASLGGSLPLSGNMKSAVNDVMRKSGAKKVSYSGGGGAASKKSRSGGNKPFSLFGDSGQSSGQASSLQFEQAEYDMSDADADIVENKGESIWRVISHRYSQSGLRRLFPDEEGPAADDKKL